MAYSSVPWYIGNVFGEIRVGADRAGPYPGLASAQWKILAVDRLGISLSILVQPWYLCSSVCLCL